jgi:hypothetical protein
LQTSDLGYKGVPHEGCKRVRQSRVCIFRVRKKTTTGADTSNKNVCSGLRKAKAKESTRRLVVTPRLRMPPFKPRAARISNI